MTTQPDHEQPVPEDPTTPAEPSAVEPADEPSDTTYPVEPTDESPVAEDQLIAGDAIMDYGARWEAIQQGFVDDPRTAVTDADTLVGEVMQQLTATFDEQHRRLEQQWSAGEPSTEDLRAALQRYRDFFQRLLAI